jgi:iron complex outermembrane receptor protein
MAHMFDAIVRPRPDTTKVRLEPDTTRAFVPFVVLTLSLVPALAHAQASGAAQAGSSQEDPEIRFRVPTITVTAQKEPEDQQKVPVSVTGVPSETLEAAGIRIVSEAAIFAPNTYFTEWSARKLSNARFRGISSSPNNPGITTYIDGVPQLNANTSSVELLDIGQIEFVRGPQSALFGRNTLGGLVNITSARPSTAAWGGTLSVPFGNHGAWGVRGAIAGPVIANELSIGVSFAEMDRDGFTENRITGNDIDTRSAFSGKAQLLWVPNATWEGRVIFNAERARDGDYSLNDVGLLRADPFVASRDFEGRADRDVTGTTVLLRRASGPLSVSSTTGFLSWRTQDVTDLDYTTAPLITRDNTEDAFQFTQELRVASADNAPLSVGNGARLRWQSGLFLFTQNYEQDAINQYAPFVFGPGPVSQHSPRSALDDFGLGLFGQATVTFDDRFDLSAGARFDYEDKSATLETFTDQQPAAGRRVDAERDFSNVSPQVSAAYRLRPDKTLYATVARGYKAGGFNPASPAGADAYGEEQTWNIEGGAKTLWADGRVSANATIFRIDWDDLQLNIPNPAVPAEFFISNVGGAVSKGVEIEIGARAAPGVDLFTAIGYTHARFGDGSSSSGVSVEGNKIPNTPDYTFSAGAQYSRPVGPATVLGRADAVFYGAFQYNDQNSLGQDAYSLVNLRFAVTHRFLTGEVLVRNAFDTRYIPLAFPYPSFARVSGFMGEMGAPRTVTVAAGVRF